MVLYFWLLLFSIFHPGLAKISVWALDRLPYPALGSVVKWCEIRVRVTFWKFDRSKSVWCQYGLIIWVLPRLILQSNVFAELRTTFCAVLLHFWLLLFSIFNPGLAKISDWALDRLPSTGISSQLCEVRVRMTFWKIDWSKFVGSIRFNYLSSPAVNPPK